MNHTEVITQIVYLQRLGAAVRQRENELRAKLADEAERALATGTVVQWRIPDVATAFAKATLGPTPVPETTASRPGKSPAAILPTTPVLETTCTSCSVMPAAVSPAMKQLDVTMREMTWTYA